jgi:hypothetical protein
MRVVIFVLFLNSADFVEVKGRAFPFRLIPPEGLSVGRYTSNSVCLVNDNSISRENHATIIQDDHGTFFVKNNSERQPILIRLSEREQSNTPRRLAQSEVLKFSFSSRIFFQFFKYNDPDAKPVPQAAPVLEIGDLDIPDNSEHLFPSWGSSPPHDWDDIGIESEVERIRIKKRKSEDNKPL